MMLWLHVLSSRPVVSQEIAWEVMQIPNIPLPANLPEILATGTLLLAFIVVFAVLVCLPWIIRSSTRIQVVHRTAPNPANPAQEKKETKPSRPREPSGWGDVFTRQENPPEPKSEEKSAETEDADLARLNGKLEEMGRE